MINNSDKATPWVPFNNANNTLHQQQVASWQVVSLYGYDKIEIMNIAWDICALDFLHYSSFVS